MSVTRNSQEMSPGLPSQSGVAGQKKASILENAQKVFQENIREYGM
jgi:hypothetical protein